ncbi:MAG: hypothetical protein LAO06_02055 [Acidobacteriia bacterium]|nr:hypothetical protein [Terriglobia bacterium]
MAALFFWAVLGGLVAGFALSVLWFDRDQAWLPAVLFGVGGGIAGGFLRKLAGASDGFDLSSMGLVILGAAALLCVYSLLALRGRATEMASHTRKAA